MAVILSYWRARLDGAVMAKLVVVEAAVYFSVLEPGIFDDIDGDHTVFEDAPLGPLTADGSEVERRPPHFDRLMNRSFGTGSLRWLTASRDQRKPPSSIRR